MGQPPELPADACAPEPHGQTEAQLFYYVLFLNYFRYLQVRFGLKLRLTRFCKQEPPPSPLSGGAWNQPGLAGGILI